MSIPVIWLVGQELAAQRPVTPAERIASLVTIGANPRRRDALASGTVQPVELDDEPQG